MDRKLLAIVQLCATNDIEANFRNCARLIHEAVVQGARFVSLPECFEYIGATPKDALSIAQPLDGPLFSRYRELAVKEQVWLSLAGFHERGPDDAHIYNSQVVVDPRGSIVAVYRKLHLFDVDIQDGRISESETTIPGNEMVLVCDTPVGNVGLTTCYDIRFPELYTCLAASGADVILVPSAFFPSTGEAHWEVLLRARAIENQASGWYISMVGGSGGNRIVVVVVV
jgi:predicted amidohydrolase